MATTNNNSSGLVGRLNARAKAKEDRLRKRRIAQEAYAAKESQMVNVTDTIRRIAIITGIIIFIAIILFWIIYDQRVASNWEVFQVTVDAIHATPFR